MFFDSWQGVARVALVGIPAYAALILLLRISGKRTLSKMNAFDLIVTVALGSTLASVLASKDVALLEGLAALTLLVALQFIVAWGAARSTAVDRLVKAEPAMLLYRGEFLRRSMRRERVTEGEILAAIRRAHIGSIEQVEAVVIETAGDLTVVLGGDAAAGSDTLRNVRRVADDSRSRDAAAGEP